MAPNDNEKIQHQPHRAGTDLRRELVACLLAHGPTFSRVGASGKPGAVHRAILALEKSAMFILQLKDYAAKDRGRRIINVNDWTRRYIDLPNNLADYAQCLVDLVSSGAGSSSPATPR